MSLSSLLSAAESAVEMSEAAAVAAEEAMNAARLAGVHARAALEAAKLAHKLDQKLKSQDGSSDGGYSSASTSQSVASSSSSSRYQERARAVTEPPVISSFFSSAAPITVRSGMASVSPAQPEQISQDLKNKLKLSIEQSQSKRGSKCKNCKLYKDYSPCLHGKYVKHINEGVKGLRIRAWSSSLPSTIAVGSLCWIVGGDLSKNEIYLRFRGDSKIKTFAVKSKGKYNFQFWCHDEDDGRQSSSVSVLSSESNSTQDNADNNIFYSDNEESDVDEENFYMLSTSSKERIVDIDDGASIVDVDDEDDQSSVNLIKSKKVSTPQSSLNTSRSSSVRWCNNCKLLNTKCLHGKYVLYFKEENIGMNVLACGWPQKYFHNETATVMKKVDDNIVTVMWHKSQIVMDAPLKNKSGSYNFKFHCS